MAKVTSHRKIIEACQIHGHKMNCNNAQRNIPKVWLLLLLPVRKHAYKQFYLTVLLDSAVNNASKMQ
jgi:hypothetical protein